MITLHQLRLLWSVAHCGSFTKASKQLGMAPPSLSQQIAKLEKTLGTPLFERNSANMSPTPAGRHLVVKAERILAEVDAAMVEMSDFADGRRGELAVGALNSLGRALLPPAMRRFAETYPDIGIDVYEVPPAEALDMLYGRRLNIALLASRSFAANASSFSESTVLTEPYVLAVPRSIDLSRVRDPWADLDGAERHVVNRSIQFKFGSQHARLIGEWYMRVFPHSEAIAQARTYDVALAMVQAGLGIAVVPALTAVYGVGLNLDVTLYRTDLPDRETVAVMPSQYLRTQPFAAFLQALQSAGHAIALPPIEPTPPFLEGRSVKVTGDRNIGLHV